MVWVNLAVSAAVVVLLFGAVFAISVRRDRHDIVDTVWGAGFALIAIASFIVSIGHGDVLTRVLVTVFTVVWGFRLAVHIGLRNRGKPEDRRYVELRARSTGNPNAHLLRKVYLPQGVIMLFVSLPVQFAQYGPATHPVLLVLGALLWLVGFGFETVGDLQLTRFKADPATKGTVLRTGLWRYTRHPNYFGDACVWWGLYLLACHSWYGIASVVCPVVMTFLLAKGTGKPLTESHLRRTRPDYADYVERTSGFFPLPPRKK